MSRMKWIRDTTAPWVEKSSCGRFCVGGPIFIGHSTYVRLYDARTDKEYPCRTVASAKAAARNMARQS